MMAALSLNLDGKIEMRRALIFMAVLVAGIFPSYAQRGPAFPSEIKSWACFPEIRLAYGQE